MTIATVATIATAPCKISNRSVVVVTEISMMISTVTDPTIITTTTTTNHHHPKSLKYHPNNNKKKRSSPAFTTNVNATLSHHAVNVPSDVDCVMMKSCPTHQPCRLPLPPTMLQRPPPTPLLPSAKYQWIDMPYPKSSVRHVIPFNQARPIHACIVMYPLPNIIAPHVTFGCPILNHPSIARNVECVVWEDERIIRIAICVECVCRVWCMRVIIVSEVVGLRISYFVGREVWSVRVVISFVC